MKCKKCKKRMETIACHQLKNKTQSIMYCERCNKSIIKTKLNKIK